MEIKFILRMIEIAIAERELELKGLLEVRAELTRSPIERRPQFPIGNRRPQSLIGNIRMILADGPATTDEVVQKLKAIGVKVDSRIRNSVRSTLSGYHRQQGEIQRDADGCWSLTARESEPSEESNAMENTACAGRVP